MAKLIASRYASALFDAGKDLDRTDLFYREILDIRGVLNYEKYH